MEDLCVCEWVYVCFFGSRIVLPHFGRFQTKSKHISDGQCIWNGYVVWNGFGFGLWFRYVERDSFYPRKWNRHTLYRVHSAHSTSNRCKIHKYNILAMIQEKKRRKTGTRTLQQSRNGVDKFIFVFVPFHRRFGRICTAIKIQAEKVCMFVKYTAKQQTK